MFNSLIERRIISNLSNLGHMFLGPYVGMLREKEIGMGRMAEPEDIFNTINNILTQKRKNDIDNTRRIKSLYRPFEIYHKWGYRNFWEFNCHRTKVIWP